MYANIAFAAMCTTPAKTVAEYFSFAKSVLQFYLLHQRYLAYILLELVKVGVVHVPSPLEHVLGILVEIRSISPLITFCGTNSYLNQLSTDYISPRFDSRSIFMLGSRN